MNEPSSSLLLIGEGHWSKKIESALIQSGAEVLIANISSRKIDSFVLKNLDEKYSHVWLCTRPNIQPVMLDRLKNYNGTIILEKPIGLSICDFEKIESSLNFEQKIFFSRVWNYSQVWRKWMEIAGNRTPKTIKIKRGDSLIRDWISPAYDWYAHDIYLLAELFGPEVHSLQDFQNSGNDFRLEAVFKLSNLETDIRYSCGYFDTGRVAMWQVDFDNGEEYTIDFTKGSIFLNRNRIFVADKKYDAISNLFLDSQLPKNSHERIMFKSQFAFARQLWRN